MNDESVRAHQSGRDSADLRKLFEVWVDNTNKARIIMFFNQNPGVIETMDGLARRLGISVEALRADISDHIQLGLIREQPMGDKTLLIYEMEERTNLEKHLDDALRSRMEGGT